MHPFMALWIWAYMSPAIAHRLLFDSTLAEDLKRFHSGA